MEEDCKHVRGLIHRESGEVSKIIYPVQVQMNGNETIETYAFCPKCGAKLGFSMFIPASHWRISQKHD